jgi:hypothetical protein
MIGAWLLLACLGPEQSTHQTKSWEILSIHQDGSLLDVRFSQSNTGMIAGQGRVRLDWVPLNTTGIQYARHALPGDIQWGSDGIWIGPDSLKNTQGDWSLQIQSDPMNARVQIKNTLTTPSKSSGNDWDIETLFAGPITGVLRSGSQAPVLSGYALGVQRQGSNPPGLRGTQRIGATVLGKDISIGIDQSGAQALAFAVIGGERLNATTAVLQKNTGGIHLDFRPATDLEVNIRPKRPHLQSDPWNHLYSVERWIAGVRFGRPVRRLRAGHAEVRLGERRINAQAVISVNDFK